MENTSPCFHTDKHSYVLGFTQGGGNLLDYFLHLPHCFRPETASRGPCGVAAEALTTALIPSTPLPRRRTAHAVVKCVIFFSRPPPLVMFFYQADSREENRECKEKDLRLKHTDTR